MQSTSAGARTHIEHTRRACTQACTHTIEYTCSVMHAHHAHACMDAHTPVYACLHVCLHGRMCACSQTNMHTCTHARSRICTDLPHTEQTYMRTYERAQRRGLGMCTCTLIQTCRLRALCGVYTEQGGGRSTQRARVMRRRNEPGIVTDSRRGSGLAGLAELIIAYPVARAMHTHQKAFCSGLGRVEREDRTWEVHETLYAASSSA